MYEVAQYGISKRGGKEVRQLVLNGDRSVNSQPPPRPVLDQGSRAGIGPYSTHILRGLRLASRARICHRLRHLLPSLFLRGNLKLGVPKFVHFSKISREGELSSCTKKCRCLSTNDA